MSGAEIGFDHRRVAGDRGWRAIGDLAAKIQDNHALDQPHDQMHVVINQQQRAAAFRRGGCEQIGEPVASQPR